MHLRQQSEEIHKAPHAPDRNVINKNPLEDENYFESVLIKSEPSDFNENSDGNSFFDSFDVCNEDLQHEQDENHESINEKRQVVANL